MRRTVISAFVLVGCAAVGLAQSSQRIQWRTDPQAAVTQAQNVKLPLMCYVLGSTEDRDDRVEAAQRKALTDARVVELSQRFVAVRLSRSGHRDLLPQFGFLPTANMEISFVSTDGKVLAKLPPSAAGDPRTLARTMAQAFGTHRQQLFNTDLRPILENQDAKPAELRAALERIRDFTIVGADTAVAALFERRRLDPKVADLAYQVLSHLSTRGSVSKLLELSAQNEKKATDALARCTPEAAEWMWEQRLTPEGEMRIDVYKAVTRICKISNPKTDKWWESAKEQPRAAELERVEKLVRAAAKSWREQYGEYR